MTVGIGGWGARRKADGARPRDPALARQATSPSSRTAARRRPALRAGKVRKLVFGFVSLD
jgi:hypothetical protein